MDESLILDVRDHVADWLAAHAKIVEAFGDDPVEIDLTNNSRVYPRVTFLDEYERADRQGVAAAEIEFEFHIWTKEGDDTACRRISGAFADCMRIVRADRTSDRPILPGLRIIRARTGRVSLKPDPDTTIRHGVFRAFWRVGPTS